MRSLASAARLLAKCTRIGEVTELVREMGFSSNLVPLTSDGINLLGLPEGLANIHIVSGDGALRALAFEIDAACDERKALTQAGTALSKHAPQLMFLLIGIHHEHRTLSIGACDSGRSRPRTSALLVRVDDIVDSDAETVCSLAAAASGSDFLTHCRWLEILGRESIGRRFFRDLEKVVATLAVSLTPRVAASEASEIALLYASDCSFSPFSRLKAGSMATTPSS